MPDDRFQGAIDKAKVDIRARKIAATQGLTGIAQANAIKNAKRAAKRVGPRDFIMEVLGQQSFYGVYMRILFWINKVLRSLTEEKKTDCEDKDVDFQLTGVQKSVMKNVLLYLMH